MSTPLTSAAITAFESERAAKALWLEWLTQWFDGNTKTIGLATGVEMPRFASDDIHFDAGAARQPLMDRVNAPAKSPVRSCANRAENHLSDTPFIGNVSPPVGP